MASEVSMDLTAIQDEDILRRLWQDTEDFSKKKEIRARMYKIREQRLKDFYTTGEVHTEITGGKLMAKTHTDSIGDQGFLTMKSKEIRDSESPTRDLNRKNENNSYWTSVKETNYSTDKTDGGFTKTSMKSNQGQGIIKNDNYETNLALASQNIHKISSKEDDNMSCKSETQNQSSRIISSTLSKMGDLNESSQITQQNSRQESKVEQQSSQTSQSSIQKLSTSSSTSKQIMGSSATVKTYEITSDGQKRLIDTKTITSGDDIKGDRTLVNISDANKYQDDIAYNQRIHSDINTLRLRGNTELLKENNSQQKNESSTSMSSTQKISSSSSSTYKTMHDESSTKNISVQNETKTKIIDDSSKQDISDKQASTITSSTKDVSDIITDTSLDVKQIKNSKTFNQENISSNTKDQILKNDNVKVNIEGTSNIKSITKVNDDKVKISKDFKQKEINQDVINKSVITTSDTSTFKSVNLQNTDINTETTQKQKNTTSIDITPVFRENNVNIQDNTPQKPISSDTSTVVTDGEKWKVVTNEFTYSVDDKTITDSETNKTQKKVTDNNTTSRDKKPDYIESPQKSPVKEPEKYPTIEKPTPIIHPTNLEISKEPTEGQYITTYNEHFSRDNRDSRVSVDHHLSHQYFASTLRASPVEQRSTPPPSSSRRTPSKSSLDRTTPDRKTPIRDIRKTPERKYSGESYTIEKHTDSLKKKVSDNREIDTETKQKRKFSSTQNKIINKTRISTPGVSPTTSPTRGRVRKTSSSDSDSDATNNTYTKTTKTTTSEQNINQLTQDINDDKTMINGETVVTDINNVTDYTTLTDLDKRRHPHSPSPGRPTATPDYSSEGSITRELKEHYKKPKSPERSAFAPIKHFRTIPVGHIDTKDMIKEERIHFNKTRIQNNSIKNSTKKSTKHSDRSPSSSPERIATKERKRHEVSPEQISPKFLDKPSKSYMQTTSTFTYKTSDSKRRSVSSSPERDSSIKKPELLKSSTQVQPIKNGPLKKKPTSTVKVATVHQTEISKKTPRKSSLPRSLSQPTPKYIREESDSVKKLKNQKPQVSDKKQSSNVVSVTTVTTTRTFTRNTPSRSKEIKKPQTPQVKPRDTTENTSVKKTTVKKTNEIKTPTIKPKQITDSKKTGNEINIKKNNQVEVSQKLILTESIEKSNLLGENAPEEFYVEDDYKPKLQDSTHFKDHERQVCNVNVKLNEKFIKQEIMKEENNQLKNKTKTSSKPDNSKPETKRNDKSIKKAHYATSESSTSEEEDNVDNIEAKNIIKREIKDVQATVTQATNQYDDTIIMDDDLLKVTIQHPKSSRESSPEKSIPISITTDDGESRYADFIIEPEDVEIFDARNLGPNMPIPHDKPTPLKLIDENEEDITINVSVADRVSQYIETTKEKGDQINEETIKITNKDVSKTKEMFENIAKNAPSTPRKTENIKNDEEIITTEIQQEIGETNIGQNDVINTKVTRNTFTDQNEKKIESKLSTKDVGQTLPIIQVQESTKSLKKTVVEPKVINKSFDEQTTYAENVRQTKSSVQLQTATTEDHKIKHYIKEDDQGPLSPKLVQEVTKLTKIKDTPQNKTTVSTKKSFFEQQIKDSAYKDIPQKDTIKRPVTEFSDSKILPKYSSDEVPSYMKDTAAASTRKEFTEKEFSNVLLTEKRRDSIEIDYSMEPEILKVTDNINLQAENKSTPHYMLNTESAVTRKEITEKEFSNVATTENRRPSVELIEETCTKINAYITTEEQKNSVKEKSKTTEINKKYSKPESPERTKHSKSPERSLTKTKEIKTEELETSTINKFGVSLKRIPSKTNDVVSPIKPTKSLEIEDIFDLEILELMLAKAIDYEERRRIRAQIRVVKKQLENLNESKSTTYTSTRPVGVSPVSPTGKKAVVETKKTEIVTTVTRSNKDYRKSPEKQRISPAKETVEKIPHVTVKTETTETTKIFKSTPEKKYTIDSVAKTKKITPEKKSSIQNTFTTNSHTVTSKSERTSPERKIVQTSIDLISNERKTSKPNEYTDRKSSQKISEIKKSFDYRNIDSVQSIKKRDSDIKLKDSTNQRKSPERKSVGSRKSPDRKETKEITNAFHHEVKKQNSKNKIVYDVKTTVQSRKISNETKENLVKGTTTDSIISSYGVGPTDDKGRPLFGLKALRSNTSTKTEEKIELTEDTTDDVRDSTGRPLFGLKALQTTTTTQEDMPSTQLQTLINKHQQFVRESQVTENLPKQKPKAKLRNSFIQDSTEDDIMTSSITSNTSDGAVSLSSIIKDDNQIEKDDSGNSIKREIQSTRTVVSSHKTVSSDGKISYKKDVITGELNAKNGQEPVGKVTRSHFSYQSPDAEESTPKIRSVTNTAIVGKKKPGTEITEITDKNDDLSTRRYSTEYTVEEVDDENVHKRRSSYQKSKTQSIEQVKESSSNRRVSEEVQTTRTKESSPTPRKSSKDDDLTKKPYVRGDSVKALQNKFQQATEAANQTQPSQKPYPKAGLILRTNSLQQSDENDSMSSTVKQSKQSTVERTGSKTKIIQENKHYETKTSKSPVTTSQAVVKSDSKTINSESSGDGIHSKSSVTTTKVVTSSSKSSFLDNKTKVTGVQDVLTRMRNANEYTETGDSVEDAEARSLLNKFLGASIILQGMEQSMNSPNSASLVSQAERNRVMGTTRKQDDIEEITDEKQLKILLEACSDYEQRRKIRARLRDIMADQKGLDLSSGGVSGSGDTVTKETKQITSGGNVITRTEVHSRVTSSARLTKANSVQSPFAKFKQLERQNSAPNVGRPTPMLKFASSNLVRSESSIKDRLLQWAQAQTRGYKNIKIENFSTSWSNGLAFCALIHHFYPDAFDYDSLIPDKKRYNFELAFRVAEEKADIYPLLDVEDMVTMRKPDWKCVFTYVQSFYRQLHNSPDALPI